MVRTQRLVVLEISAFVLAFASCVEPPLAGVEADAQFAVMEGSPGTA